MISKGAVIFERNKSLLQLAQSDHLKVMCVVQYMPRRYGFGINFIHPRGGQSGICLLPPKIIINDGGYHFSMLISPFRLPLFFLTIHLGNWRSKQGEYALWFSLCPFAKGFRSGFGRRYKRTKGW